MGSRMREMKCVYGMVWYGTAMEHLIFFGDDDGFFLFVFFHSLPFCFYHLSSVKFVHQWNAELLAVFKFTYKHSFKRRRQRQRFHDVTHCIFHKYWSNLCAFGDVFWIKYYIHIVLKPATNHTAWIQSIILYLFRIFVATSAISHCLLYETMVCRN